MREVQCISHNRLAGTNPHCLWGSVSHAPQLPAERKMHSRPGAVGGLPSLAFHSVSGHAGVATFQCVVVVGLFYF